jgi:competence protein ComEA
VAFGAQGKVNINTAGEAELTLLPRVGPSIAQRILEHREENGKFQAVEDIMLVRGIGEKTFALMKPYLSLSGETTLREKVRASQVSPSSEGPSDGSAHRDQAP